jgi:hypothetical protein
LGVQPVGSGSREFGKHFSIYLWPVTHKIRQFQVFGVVQILNTYDPVMVLGDRFKLLQYFMVDGLPEPGELTYPAHLIPGLSVGSPGYYSAKAMMRFGHAWLETTGFFRIDTVNPVCVPVLLQVGINDLMGASYQENKPGIKIFIKRLKTERQVGTCFKGKLFVFQVLFNSGAFGSQEASLVYG